MAWSRMPIERRRAAGDALDMARQPRFDFSGIPQHVVQRGNNRLPCFLDDEDRQRYLQCLLSRFDGRLHACVLMSNHADLLLTPASAGAVSRLMHTFARNYNGLFNERHGRTGTLWEGRFKARLDSGRYFLACSRYIELNPVRAWTAAQPGDYPWSSHGANAGLSGGGLGDRVGGGQSDRAARREAGGAGPWERAESIRPRWPSGRWSRGRRETTWSTRFAHICNSTRRWAPTGSMNGWRRVQASLRGCAGQGGRRPRQISLTPFCPVAITGEISSQVASCTTSVDFSFAGR